MNKLIFDIRQSVFPLYKVSEAKGRLIDVDFLGTCFFMKLGRWIVLFTARHNLNVQLPQNEHYVVAERTNDDTNLVTITGVFTKKLSEDVSFVLVDSDALTRFKKPVVPLDLYEVQLNMGTDVFTFGFPLTKKQYEAEAHSITIHENHLFLKGHVQNIIRREFFKDSTTEGFELNYLLSFRSLHGLSGAPLLVGLEDSINVAGIIYSNSSVDYLTDSWEERKIDNNIERIETVTRYEFGVPSTFFPISEVKKMLDDFEQKQKNKK